MTKPRQAAITRRDFVGSSAAVFAATALPHPLRSQQPTHRRYEISSPNMPPRMRESYKKAIREMLKLPPTDPRNWYRNAFIHAFDCTHDNWWFFVWHRAYLGWFEKTCRQLSEDPEFALPYWDWTENPRIPAAMFEGELDPNHEAYIGTFEEFYRGFKEPVEGLWASFTDAQREHLARRDYANAVSFWDDLRFMFFERPMARGPELDSKIAPQLTTEYRMALIERYFAGATDQRPGFASPKTENHESRSHQTAILEHRLHGAVHWGRYQDGPQEGLHDRFSLPCRPNLLSPSRQY